MSDQAKLVLNIKGNTLEISGPEAFVSAQVQLFQEAITTALEETMNQSAEPQTNVEVSGPPPAPHQEPAAGGNPYPNVLHIDGTTVRLLRNQSGVSKAEKAVGTALLYLWGKKRAGIDSAPFSEIREQCQKHACLDSANFSSTMKEAREYLIVDGPTHRSLSCSLTEPGMKRAEELLKQLNAG